MPQTEGIGMRDRRKGEVTELERALGAEVNGDTLFDDATRAVYSTDASNYRHVPAGVVLPRTAEAAAAAVRVADAHGVPVVSRGAGTSVAGNACGTGLVLDFSKYCNKILHIDPENRLARVEPGVVLDDLQAAAAPHGLMFGPDPSTHSRCTLGGMIGNNACGAHSLAWGKTVDNVESLDVLLADGTRLELGQTPRNRLDQLMAEPGRSGALHRELAALRDDLLEAIRTEFPHLPRRVSGYNLDQLLQENDCHVARALVGSEGTCAVVLGATVRLVRPPNRRVLVVLGFSDDYAAADHVGPIRDLNVLAIEGIDANLVDVVRRNKPGSPALAHLPEGRSWLLVEVGGDGESEAESAAQRVVATMETSCSAVIVSDPARARALWRVREEGVGLATRTTAGRPAVSGWEDAAVPPENLGAYLREFDQLLARYGRRGITYGHYGDGCVHVRIDFDLRDPAEVRAYRDVLGEAAELVVAHGGSLSGEHGDGQARSELLSTMYSDPVLGGFRRFKSAFDPRGRLNPGRIVDPLPLDADLRMLVAPPRIPSRTELALPEDGADLAVASQRCVGVGKCLNRSGGVMCPSYRATGEERYSTRGRSRLLFEMVNGEVVTGGWRSQETREALDLCLSCKGCKTDCPAGVDMATYKAEFLHHHYAGRPRPLTHYSMGFLPVWLAVAGIAPSLVNRMSTSRLEPLLKRLAGIAPERALPPLASRRPRSWQKRSGQSSGQSRVLLFPDTFTKYFEPAIGRDAVRVLEELGYFAEVPRTPLCCGLTWFSTGQLGIARHVLRRTARQLRRWTSADVPVVGLEPSCTAFLRCDARELAPGDPDVRSLSESTMTFAQTIAPALRAWDSVVRQGSALVQYHCHQYADLDVDADRQVLEAVATPVVLDSGCCGLAGNSVSNEAITKCPAPARS